MALKIWLPSIYRSWSRADLDQETLRIWDKRNDLYDDGDLGAQLALAYALRREHAARVWQAMQALWFAAYTYEWGVTDGEECTKPKYRPVDNTK